MKEQEISQTLALSCQILASHGHSDVIFGHVSARGSENNQYHMKPSGIGLEEVKEEDIIVIDRDGNLLFGDKGVHSEYPIHCEIYTHREEINCVIHTHPEFATALGAANEKILPISHEGVLFPDIPIFSETTELILNSEQGAAIAKKIAGSRAMLLQNHGVVVAGESIEEATIYAIILEKAAKMQCITKNFDRVVYSDAKESKIKEKQIYNHKHITAMWNYYVRKISA